MAEWDHLKILPNYSTMARYSAERIVRMINATLEYNETFSIALAGGNTPHRIYQVIGTMFARLVDWSRVHIWWGDERCVPMHDKQSNYRKANETLLNKIKIPAENIHRIRGEDDPKEAAKKYEDELKTFFEGEDILFDLTLLGLGEDGHTASLFPHTDALFEKERWVIAHHVEEKGDLWRVTLTPPTILKSGNIMFMVLGRRKANALKAVLDSEYQPDVYPAQLIEKGGHEHVVWVVDKSAATKIN